MQETGQKMRALAIQGIQNRLKNQSYIYPNLMMMALLYRTHFPLPGKQAMTKRLVTPTLLSIWIKKLQ